MYKFVKKEIVAFYVSQCILISLVLFCAVLPCFMELKSFTGAWAILGFVGLSCIVALNVLIVERGWYRLTEIQSVFFQIL